MKNKHPLSSKAWLWLFAGTLAFLLLLIPVFNVCTDPFGVFGDPFMKWWGYDATLNPRTAKLSYLEENHDKYDSYIIGPSSTSSYPQEALNRYFGGSFYNLTMYGADMQDVEQMGLYVLEHYRPRNLVVSVYIHCAEVYGTEANALTYAMPCAADGSSPLLYYGKYLFANPRYGYEKLSARRNDPYLQQPYRVFEEESGAYDKSRRDAEPIGDLEAYLDRETYSFFRHYPVVNPGSIDYLEECMDAVTVLRDRCQELGVRFTVVCPPMYWEYQDNFTPQQQESFFNALAQVTDYWDFTLSSASYDPRFFYDETHFRNALGTQCIARMFGDDGVCTARGLGRFVEKGSIPGAPEGEASDPAQYSARVPILLYHHLDASEGKGSDIISVSRFREHMDALQAAGYHTVSFGDLEAYVREGIKLPEKPVVITFDDGYRSNYTLAYPILKEYGMKATIFPIGVSVGKDTYKDTGKPIFPHFTLEEAREMEASGLIEIESHGYDLHRVDGLDPEPVRRGALPLEGEAEEHYVDFLRSDFEAMTQVLGETPHVFAYPFGFTGEIPEVLFRELGITSTVTTVPKTNTVIQGLPQSLCQLGRYYATQDQSGEQLLAMLEGS